MLAKLLRLTQRSDCVEVFLRAVPPFTPSKVTHPAQTPSPVSSQRRRASVRQSSRETSKTDPDLDLSPKRSNFKINDSSDNPNSEAAFRRQARTAWPLISRTAMYSETLDPIFGIRGLRCTESSSRKPQTITEKSLQCRKSHAERDSLLTTSLQRTSMISHAVFSELPG